MVWQSLSPQQHVGSRFLLYLYFIQNRIVTGPSSPNPSSNLSTSSTSSTGILSSSFPSLLVDAAVSIASATSFSIVRSRVFVIKFFFVVKNKGTKVRSDGQQVVSKHALTVVTCFVKKERGNNLVLTCFFYQGSIYLCFSISSIPYISLFSKSLTVRKILAKMRFVRSAAA